MNIQARTNKLLQLHFIPAFLGSILIGLIIGKSGFQYLLIWLFSWLLLRIALQLIYDKFYGKNRRSYWLALIVMSSLPYVLFFL